MLRLDHMRFPPIDSILDDYDAAVQFGHRAWSTIPKVPSRTVVHSQSFACILCIFSGMFLHLSSTAL